jgi:hypothetical protein
MTARAHIALGMAAGLGLAAMAGCASTKTTAASATGNDSSHSSAQGLVETLHKNVEADTLKGDAAKIKVRVVIELAPDFTVKAVGLDDTDIGRYKSDPAYRAKAEAAFKAVRRASPLPLSRSEFTPDSYDKWHYISVDFDPSETL